MIRIKCSPLTHIASLGRAVHPLGAIEVCIVKYNTWFVRYPLKWVWYGHKQGDSCRVFQNQEDQDRGTTNRENFKFGQRHIRRDWDFLLLDD